MPSHPSVQNPNVNVIVARQNDTKFYLGGGEKKKLQTFSPASLLRVLFMICSRRCTHRTKKTQQLSCGFLKMKGRGWTFKAMLLRTFFLSSRSCSSFWKCFSLSTRCCSASSRALASASSLCDRSKQTQRLVRQHNGMFGLRHHYCSIFVHCRLHYYPSFHIWESWLGWSLSHQTLGRRT